MKRHWTIHLSIFLTLVLIAASLSGVVGIWWLLAIAAALLVAIAMLAGALLKIHSAVDNGYNLLLSQDFSSRLRLTGNPEADKLAELFNDMMATMKAERLRLMEQNLFMTKLIEVSPLGIAICDFDGRIIETNSRYRDLISPALRAVLESLGEDESRMVRMDSAQVYRCSRLWFMDAGFRRSFYLIEVMTEEIVASERKVYSTVVRTIGHEVNDTLSPVVSLFESLSEDPVVADDPMIHNAVKGCKASCINLIEFVRGYADVVKLPAPKLVETDLAVEIPRLLPALKTIAGTSIRVEFRTLNDQFMLPLDMILIDRAILNIVKNSVESIGNDSDGRIIIELDGATLRITDNGCGIDPCDADRIFTPFFSTKRPDRGLGLLLVSDILRAHRASFRLTTDGTTSLTTFTICFAR